MDPLVKTISKYPQQSWGLDLVSRSMRLGGAADAAPIYFGRLNGGRTATAIIFANALPKPESGRLSPWVALTPLW